MSLLSNMLERETLEGEWVPPAPVVSGVLCTCGTALLPNIPLRMARHRPTITSSLMFSMMPAASPAISASRMGAGERTWSRQRLLHGIINCVGVNKGNLFHLCRGSRRGIVHPDSLWWSRHDQTGWHWDPRTRGQSRAPPADREGIRHRR